MSKARVYEMVASLEEVYDTTDIEVLLTSIRVCIQEVDYLSGSKLAYSYDDKIVIRNDLAEELRQFVILHELGHLLLHNEPIYTFRTNTSTLKLEKEANDFALLILAKYYHLSPEDIRFRLNDFYQLNL